MRQFLAIALSLVTLSVSEAQFRRGGYTYAAPPVARPAPKAVSKKDELMDGSHDGRYNSGDVADMPSGSDKLYMTLVTSDDWQTDPGPRGQAQRKLKSWLENDKRLISYKGSSNWNWYTQSDPHFTGARTLADGKASSLRARFGEAYPILAVENSSGEALFKMSAMSLPANGGELADWITSSLKAKSAPAPVFSGQSEATPVVTEGVIGQCGPDGCPPVNVPSVPNDSSEVIDDTAKPFSGGGYGGLAVLGFCGVAAAGLGVVAARRPGVKR